MKVLVISVHPDDETLGCGGTLLKHKAQGDDLYWLVVTEAYTPQWSQEVIDRKAEEVRQVAAAYGMADTYKLGFPTVRLDTTPQSDLIDAIREVIDTVRPEVIYLTHDGDVHTDHHAVFLATLSVVKPFYMRHFGVKKVLVYETLSSTDAAPPQPKRVFLPIVLSDITATLDQKIEIMKIYHSEAQDDLLPRGSSAIRALARYRGATIGVEYAEAFMPVREIW
jgi:LmbE family N-acetylglucosaminyl deacetylase